MKIAIGLASGLGNCVMMLPIAKALGSLGHNITLYVEDDNRSAGLWGRCAYADDVIQAPDRLDGHKLMCGLWRPASWAGINGIARHILHPPYLQSEVSSNFRLALDMGYDGDVPDVSDWCRDLDRTFRWDIGIVPGCKGGYWIRKRYPQMNDVAAYFLERGESVAVFGREDDGIAGIWGEHVKTPNIEQLPDVLAGCRVIIGTDSGVTHLANSLGIPTVVVHTASSTRKATPVHRRYRQVFRELPCRPCQSTPRWDTCHDWKCREIDPACVIQAAEELLNA